MPLSSWSKTHNYKLLCTLQAFFSGRSHGPKTQLPGAFHHISWDPQSHPEVWSNDRLVTTTSCVSLCKIIAVLGFSNDVVFITWQESFPPSRYPAQIMFSVIWKGYALKHVSSLRRGASKHCNLSGYLAAKTKITDVFAPVVTEHC